MDYDLKTRAKQFIKTTKQFPDLDQDDEKLLHHSVVVDGLQLLDFEVSLLEFVLTDADQGAWLFQQLIQDEIREKYQRYIQVSVKVVLANLPKFPHNGNELEAKNYLQTPPLTISSTPFTFRGQLVGKSRKYQYPLTSRYFCQNLECLAHQKRHFVDIPHPETSKFSKRCTFCESLMTEIIEARQVSHLIQADFQSTDPDLRLNQPLSVIVRYGLIQELNLGETYEIVAKVAGNNANNNEDGFIECISLSTFKNVLSRMFNSCDEDPSIELNPAIDRLYRASQGSPWSFVHKLALKFGDHIAPMGTFHHLKLGLLFSLAVTKSNPEDPYVLPLFVAVLDESDFPAKLLKYGLSLFETGYRVPIIHSESSVMCSQVKKEGKVMAGSLVMAKDTVCYLGEMVKYKKSVLDTIKKVLESGQIPILPIDEEDGLELCPLLASIWTHCSVTATKAGRNRDKRQKIREFCSAMKPFIDVFGTVYICQEEDSDSQLMYHMLSMDQVNFDDHLHDGLKNLLMQVQEKKLHMAPDASRLLKKYFVASRRARVNETLKGTEFPLKALQVVTTMAEAHAKLSLCSNKVTVFDAVAAIKLYEENMVAQCGYSCIIKQQHQEQDGHQNYDETMRDFFRQLESFVDQFVGDMSISLDFQQSEE